MKHYRQPRTNGKYQHTGKPLYHKGCSDISNIYQGFQNLQHKSHNLQGSAADRAIRHHKVHLCKLTLHFGLDKVQACNLT